MCVIAWVKKCVGVTTMIADVKYVFVGGSVSVGVTVMVWV